MPTKVLLLVGFFRLIRAGKGWLTKLRNELQYRIELCPCGGLSGDTVVLQVKNE
jgi:hypothetical protein